MIKVSFLGDSITDAYGASDRKHLGYVNNLAKSFPLIAQKYAVSGTRISRDKGKHYKDNFLDRAKKMDPNTDFVFVMGGTNDFGHGFSPLGKIGCNDEYTFCGACDSLMKSLTKKFGNEKICFILPIPRIDENILGSVEPPLKHLATLDTYRKIIQEEAKYHRIKTLDISDVFNDVNKLTVDGLHPNDLGHEIIAKALAKYLRKLGFK